MAQYSQLVSKQSQYGFQAYNMTCPPTFSKHTDFEIAMTIFEVSYSAVKLISHHIVQNMYTWKKNRIFFFCSFWYMRSFQRLINPFFICIKNQIIISNDMIWMYCSALFKTEWNTLLNIINIHLSFRNESKSKQSFISPLHYYLIDKASGDEGQNMHQMHD